jgi:HD-like signal output (HDOD) protein
MLGLNSVMAVAMGVAMRQAMRGDETQGLERFWDSAEATANMCALVARRFRLVDADEAFSYGLFHDCGIPMLTARFPDYKDVLRKANANDGRSFTSIEDELIGTNHAVVGHFVARSWLFPDALCEAISLHHDLDAFETTDFKSGSARPLIAIGHVAEHIQHVRRRGSEDVEWDKFGDATLSYLGIGQGEFEDLVEELGGQA